MDPKRVEFPTSDGYTLRGDLYRTEVDHAPIVVLVPGVRSLQFPHCPLKLTEHA